MKNNIKQTCLFILLACSVLVQAQIPASEKQYLIEFNQSTVGEQWQQKWDLTADPSTWHGV